MRKPKYWNTRFAVRVLDAFDAGKLNFDNVTEWETEENGGIKPMPSLGAMEILDYHYFAGEDMR